MATGVRSDGGLPAGLPGLQNAREREPDMGNHRRPHEICRGATGNGRAWQGTAPTR
jgi:hypothetical protein